MPTLGPAVISGTVLDGSFSFPVSIERTDGAAIDPNQTTWVIIHGWNSDPERFDALVAAIHSQRPSDQILVLDWSVGAGTGIFNPFDAEDRIPLVASWAAAALASSGFSGSNLNLIGHSFGAYIAGELAEQMAGGVNTIVALDPAVDISGGYNPGGAAGVNFAQVSQFSWVLHDAVSSHFEGNDFTPATADEAFDVLGSSHSAIVDLFTAMLNDPSGGGGTDQYFELDRLLAHETGPWALNRYDQNAVQSTNGQYEAVISTTGSGTIAQSIAYVPLSASSNPPGSVSVSDVSITEGNSGTKLATFTVTRTGGTGAFSVNYGTANGTATTTGNDYTAKSGLLSFADGVDTQSVSVTIRGDTSIESNETFFLNLTNATNGAAISDVQGQGTIINDDGPGSIAISDVSITEGNSGTQVATFTVTRTGGTSAFSVHYATANGTATTANGDYTGTSGTLSFASGVTQKTISVTIKGDTRVEGNETFFVNLSSATNGVKISDSQGKGTILNDDGTTIASSLALNGLAAGNSSEGVSASLTALHGLDTSPGSDFIWQDRTDWTRDWRHDQSGPDHSSTGTDNDVLAAISQWQDVFHQFSDTLTHSVPLAEKLVERIEHVFHFDLH